MFREALNRSKTNSNSKPATAGEGICMSSIIYRSEHCYPDVLDLESAIEKVGLNVDPEKIYQDFRAAFEWIRAVQKVCHNRGKHTRVAASDVLRIAETFIGRKLNKKAFRAALHVSGLCRVRDPKTACINLDQLTVKVPHLDRTDVIANAWNAHVAEETDRASS
jgi:hypothetical protein